MTKYVIAVGLAAFVFLSIQFSGRSETNAAENQSDCVGTLYEGAWFSAQIPTDMEVQPSLTSSSGEGADSIWVRSEDGQTEFYLYSPQWSGTPYDIFVGAQDRNELTRQDTQTDSFVELELTYESSVGRFEIAQSSDPVSHKTVGYRTTNGELSPESSQKYDCFKISITQYAD